MDGDVEVGDYGKAYEGHGGARIEGDVEWMVFVVEGKDLAGDWGQTVQGGGWVVIVVRCQVEALDETGGGWRLSVG